MIIKYHLFKEKDAVLRVLKDEYSMFKVSNTIVSGQGAMNTNKRS